MTLANASLLTATGRGCPAGLGRTSAVPFRDPIASGSLDLVGIFLEILWICLIIYKWIYMLNWILHYNWGFVDILLTGLCVSR